MMFVAHDAPEYGHIFACDLLDAKRGIARRCGCTLEEFEAVFSELCEAGVPGIKDGIVYSRRMVRDASLRDVRAKAGRKGGKQSAKQKASKAQAKCQAKPKQNTEDEDDKEDEIEDGFNTCWKAVSRKEGRGAAEIAYGKAVARVAGQGIEDPAGFLLDRMTQFAKSPRGRAGKHCPHPATWLNQGRYDDDPAVWQLAGNDRDPRGIVDAAAEYLGGFNGE